MDDLHILHFWTGTVFDACWHHTLDVDPIQHAKIRRRMILELARFGRFGGGLHEWDDEPVSELQAWWNVLKEMMDHEDALARAAEDR
jgi:hypothetical protein